jgi:hypothetical protein
VGFGPSRHIARLSPIDLPPSKQVRLERMYKASVYKPDVAQLQLPIASADESARELVAALRELVPPDGA